MSKDFYPDLKTLEENLFAPQQVEQFISNYGLPLIIENATTATNDKSKSRLRDLFRKISNTPHLGQILLMFNDKDAKNVKLLNNFMSSANSDMLFDYFQNYGQELVSLIKKQPKTISLLLSLIDHESGLRVLKTFQKIYKNHQDLEALFSQQAKDQLLKGIHNQNSTVSMRYIELVTNIATYSQTNFNFIKNGKMLDEALNQYNTKDTLLKLNVVEIMELFGNSPLTGEYLKKSSVWEQIVKQAFNSNEEFYVRKSLIVLVAKMSSINCYDITPADAKNFTIFLKEMLSSKLVDEIDAGLDVICYLGKTPQGFSVITHSEEIAQKYVQLSQAPGQNTRRKYIASLDSIVDRKGSNKPYASIVTLLSCIGDPTLAKSHNLTGSHPILSGLPQFAKWFYSYLLLPFEQLKLGCIQFFKQVLEYKQVCVELFTSKNALQFFKKKLHRYDLTNAKKELIEQILKRGDGVWKGHELQVFSNLLRTQMMKGESNEAEYAVQSK